MDTSAMLRKAVAEYFEVEEGQVGPSFPLSGRRGQGSIARAALDSVIRNRVGIKSRAVYTAKTYGELEGEIAPGAAVGVVAPIPVSDESPAASRQSSAAVSCGVDIELIENLPGAADYWEDPFYRATFAPSEIAYCLMQESPPLHFAARWCAKEALKKCERETIDVDMKDLEVVTDESGAPSFVFHSGGVSRKLPHAVSLSHTSHAAIAVVVWTRGTGQVVVLPEPRGVVSETKVLEPEIVASGVSVALMLLLMTNLVVAVLALLRTFPSFMNLFAR